MTTRTRKTTCKPVWKPGRLTPALLVLALVMLPMAGANAAEPTLDDMLEIGGATTQPSEKNGAQPAAGSTDKNTGPVVDPREARRALEQEERQAGDAFRKAVAEMYQVSERIGKNADTSRDVQRDQEEIVRKLDQVIEAAEKSQGKGSSSSKSSGKPRSSREDGNSKNQQGQPQGQQQGQQQGQGQGQQQSQAAAGANPGMGGPGGGVGITTPLAELRERWGNLPGRVREQLMQGVQEKVSPVYREWTEQYYKRLAEDQP